ncbi:hypothetical protein OROHE_013554 [Orobanche hederae]
MSHEYDQGEMGEVIAQYILVDELPFSHVESYMFNKQWGIFEKIGTVSVDNAKAKIYGEAKQKIEFESVKNSLYKLLKEYLEVEEVLRGKLNEGKFGEGSNLKRQGSSQEGFAAGISEFSLFADDSGHELENIKSELDIYLGEPCYKFPDCLEWWKVNSPKYLILSKMAQDILAIPVTNVASESAFSAGGRVIEPHRAFLKPETVQVLLCGGDWARELWLKRIFQRAKKDNKVELQEIEIDLYETSSASSVV